MVKLVYRTDEIKNVRDIFDKIHYISMFYHFGLYLVGKRISGLSKSKYLKNYP